MRISPVASRYAKALFQFAVEKSCVDILVEDMETAAKIVEDYPEFAEIFFHPRLGLEQKREIVKEVFEPALKSPFSSNFLHLLLNKQRESEIAAISEKFSMLCDEYKGQIPVEVVVAAPIADQQLQGLMQKVNRVTNKQPIPTIRVDKEIIGGVILKFADKVIDGSIKSRLQSLEKQLKAIPVAEMRGE